MIGNLSATEMDHLMQHEHVGRIGCNTSEGVYIVPVSYAFQGNCIYGHTREGMKLNAMRAAPDVCFEVDNITNLANWQSVIAWGRFEAVTDEVERKQAIDILMHRHLPLVTGEVFHLTKTWPFYNEAVDTVDGVIFKITLTKRTGKFEKSHQHHATTIAVHAAQQ